MQVLFTGLLAYLIGSIPSGLLFGKALWQTDLRRHGSKNIGATNAYRILGPRAAALVFIADFLKGAAGVWLGAQLSGQPTALLIGGIAAIAGHNWSLFLGFSGGKGVATGLGVIAMLMPAVTALVFALWCLVVYFTRYVSLASIAAAACVPLGAYICGEPPAYFAFGVLAAAFVIYRHKANIGRLLNGTESKIKAGHRR